MEGGGRRQEAGGWRQEAGGWRLEAGGWSMGVSPDDDTSKVTLHNLSSGDQDGSFVEKHRLCAVL